MSNLWPLSAPINFYGLHGDNVFIPIAAFRDWAEKLNTFCNSFPGHGGCQYSAGYCWQWQVFSVLFVITFH